MTFLPQRKRNAPELLAWSLLFKLTMPRKSLNLDLRLEHLSILDAEGHVDSELEPDLSDDMLQALHRSMLRVRRFDERMLSLQRQGRLGTFAPVKGQEASQLGAVANLSARDWLVPSYRETAALLWRGTSMPQLLLSNAGYNEGNDIPDDRNDLPVAVPVGTQMLHAAGLAYGLRLQHQGAESPCPIAMTFFGDGATSEGDFHEALNFASVFDSPTVFVCENNGYAISLPRSRQTTSRTLAQKAFAYDMAALQVDGNDILAVYVGCQQAVARARQEHRPTLIECLTYRLEVHTTVDDPSKYRDEEEVERWRKRDPLPRFQGYLRRRGLLNDDDLASLENDIQQELAQATTTMDERIEATASDREVIFEHILKARPAYTERQRAQLLAVSHG